MKHDAFDTLALAPHIQYNALDMPASTAHVNSNVFDMLALASGLKESIFNASLSNLYKLRHFDMPAIAPREI